MSRSSRRFALRDLSLAPRLVMAVFLLSVGLGYVSALVQVHFQHAAEGQLMPGPKEVVKEFHGESDSQLDRLLMAPESRPFNGHGTMAPAFTSESLGWKADVATRGEAAVRAERDGEREVVLHWARHGADQKAYDEDSYPLPPELINHPLTRHYVIAPGAAAPASVLERLLTAPETKVFSGEGTMAPAFTTKSAGWARDLKAARKSSKECEQDLLKERTGERLALVDWVKAGAPKQAWDADRYVLSQGLAGQLITDEYLVKDESDKPVSPRAVKVQTLFTERCVRCHAASGGASDKARKIPLEKYEQVQAYCEIERPGDPSSTAAEPRVRIRSIVQDRCARCHTAEGSSNDKAAKCPLDSYDRLAVYTSPDTSGGMPIRGLAQTTHVHLLGFSMLFMLTGLVFSFTSFPVWVRACFGPFPLLAQLADISCWWLARLDPLFAKLILVTGVLVALGLGIHIAGSLFSMFFSKPQAASDA
jgi:mono/diheme cytochrome c family protein